MEESELQQFLQTFHNLGGRNIDEHNKNFTLFANSLKKLTSEQTASFLKALTPKNVQEHVFRIELCMRFETFEILYEYLVSGHRLLSKIVAKDVRFARLFAEKFDGQQFVTRICPEISFVNRYRLGYKLVKAISTDALGDDYFIHVKDKYGLKLATPFLIVCSERIVRGAVEEYQVELNQLQLLKINKKFVGFLRYYLESCETKLGDHKKLASFLVRTDLKSYHELVKDFGAPVLGKRSFDKYLKAYKEKIVVNEKYKSKQMKLAFYRLPKNGFNAYFKQFFTKDFNGYRFIQYTKVLPINSRESLLVDLFDNVYNGKSFQVNSDLLEVFSLNDRLKYLNESSNIELFDCEKSIPVIIEKLLVSNNEKEWIPKLIKTCKINNNPQALLKTLQLFFNERKLDFLNFKSAFLLALSKEYDLHKLSEQHWILIEELIKDTLNEGKICWYDLNLLLGQLLLHKASCDIDYESTLEMLFKRGFNTEWPIFNNNQKLLRECLIHIPGILDKLNITDTLSYYRFLFNIYKFNKSNPKSKISSYSFPQCFEKFFETIDYNKKHLLYVIGIVLDAKPNNLKESQVREKYVELFVEKSNEYKYSIYNYLLKYDPEKVAVEHFFQSDSYFNDTFYEKISRLNFLNVDEKLKQIALGILNDSNSGTNILVKAIKFLSHSDNFLKIIEHLHPKPDRLRLDLDDPDLAGKLKIHKTILTGLKFQSHPHEMIKTVLHYCQGDYLRHALGPLYFVNHHSPEKYINETLGKFLSSTLSTRKHASYLATSVCDIDTAYSILRQIGDNESNTYVLKFLIRRHLKFFCENPTDRLFNLLLKHLSLPGVNFKDERTASMLVLCRKVPRNYHSTYIECIWKIAKDRELETELLRHVSSDLFKKFPNNFCDEIIKNCLFKEHPIINLFYVYLNDSDMYAKRWDKIVEVIKAETNVEVMNLHEPLAKIDSFMRGLCTLIIRNKSNMLVSDLRKSMQNLHININKFYYENALDATEFLVHSSDDSFLPVFVHKQYLSLLELYGDEIVDAYSEFVKKFYSEILCAQNITFLHLCVSLLNVCSSNETIRLVNLLMPNDISKHDNLSWKLQEDVVAKIWQKNGDIPLDLLKQFSKPNQQRRHKQMLGDHSVVIC